MMDVNKWARTAGVSLRPWSGHSPRSLIVRGVLQTAVSAMVFYFGYMIAFGDVLEEIDRGMMKNFGIILMVVCTILILLGLTRIAIGIYDSMSRRTVTGIVVDVSERRLGDILPRFVQNSLFTKNDNSYDERKYRTELVLDTHGGLSQWTILRTKDARLLQPGQHVRLTVTPITGHISTIDHV